ncbi:microtubule-associated tumor suppressor 1 [Arapaima gigas]
MSEHIHDDSVGPELLCTGMHLPLCSGDQHCNVLPCGSSSDSMRSLSSLSDSGSPSLLDMEMLDYGLGQEDPFYKRCSGVLLPQKPAGSSGTGMDLAALDPTDRLTRVPPSAEETWNKNMTFVITDSQMYTSDGRSEDSSDLSPGNALDEEAKQWPVPDDQSCPESKGTCSRMRVKSSLSQALSISGQGQPPEFSSDVLEGVVPSRELPDVCKGLQEKTQTYTFPRDPDSRSPQEKLDGLRGGEPGFLEKDRSTELPCQTGEREGDGDSADVVSGDLTIVLSSSGACTSSVDGKGTFSDLLGKTYVVTGSEDSDSGCATRTSTPVQRSGNQTLIISSFCESPFQMRSGNVGSPLSGTKGWERGATPVKPLAGSKAPVAMARQPNDTDVKQFPKQVALKSMKPRAGQRPTPLKLTTPKPTSFSKGSASPAGLPASCEGPAVTHKAGQKRPAGSDGSNRHRSPSNLSKVFPVKVGRVADGAPALKTKREAVAADICLSPAGSTTSDTAANGSPLLSKATVQSESTRKANRSRDVPRAKGCATGKLPESSRADGSSPSAAPPSKLSVSTERGGSRLGPRASPGKMKLQTSGVAKGTSPASRGKPAPAAGTSKMRLTERPSVAIVPKLPLNPSLKPPRPSSRLPVKGPAKSPSSSSLTSSHSAQGGAPPASPASGAVVGQLEGKPPRPGTAGGALPTKAVVKRNRTTSLPERSMANGGGTRSSALSPIPLKSSARPLQRPGSARPQRPAGPLSVDKTKPRPMTRSQQTQGPSDLLPTEPKASKSGLSRAQCDRQNQQIQQLRQILASRTQGLEALAVVVQHISVRREEALKQKKELALELVNLREELLNSTSAHERLQQEKEELRVTLEGILQKVQEQHQQDLADLEDRLKAFYSAQWEELHQAYQEEADRCRNLMQQVDVDELRSRHETQRSAMEESHREAVEKLRQHYEASFEELRNSHEQEVQVLNQTMKEAEVMLTGQVEELMAENNTLHEKLKAEEEKRRALAEKNQKDSHTLYLEQELESLKVVLDIKNKQLHQQDQKLMQMDKLVETNVKLEESLKKVQQENEDYRVRMDKHAALSRQLSSEQAVLQQCLQKETKVNKRLSMENEELLWKLHNGDLSSPRKLSPTSPFQSPRNSAAFSSYPLPPR